jgi:hypothetical protein
MRLIRGGREELEIIEAEKPNEGGMTRAQDRTGRRRRVDGKGRKQDGKKARVQRELTA